MSIYGSGFSCKHGLMTGFMSDEVDGMFFLEYQTSPKGKKNERVVKELGKKLRIKRDNDGLATKTRWDYQEKYQKQIKLWVKRLYEHCYGKN